MRHKGRVAIVIVSEDRRTDIVRDGSGLRGYSTLRQVYLVYYVTRGKGNENSKLYIIPFIVEINNINIKDHGDVRTIK